MIHFIDTFFCLSLAKKYVYTTPSADPYNGRIFHNVRALNFLLESKLELPIAVQKTNRYKCN